MKNRPQTRVTRRRTNPEAWGLGSIRPQACQLNNLNLFVGAVRSLPLHFGPGLIFRDPDLNPPGKKHPSRR